MDTDTLIARLSADTTRVLRQAAPVRVAAWAGIGVLLSLILLVSALEYRSDLSKAVGLTSFWAKAAFTSSIGAFGLLFVEDLSRPDSAPPPWLWLALPLALLAAVATVQVLSTEPGQRWAMIMGPGWTCLPMILALSSPIFILLIACLRSLAPTRLATTGAVAGMAAGGLGATVYGLSCHQESAIFLLTRYTTAIALLGAIGALTGPRLLRW
jgi:hypothetical protein